MEEAATNGATNKRRYNKMSSRTKHAAAIAALNSGATYEAVRREFGVSPHSFGAWKRLGYITANGSIPSHSSNKAVAAKGPTASASLVEQADALIAAAPKLRDGLLREIDRLNAALGTVRDRLATVEKLITPQANDEVKSDTTDGN